MWHVVALKKNYAVSYINIQLHVSVTFATLIRAPLQEYWWKLHSFNLQQVKTLVPTVNVARGLYGHKMPNYVVVKNNEL
jgi:hypothetical protein